MKNLEEQAFEIWDEVCQSITAVLQECKLYGLANILTLPDPSLESRLKALKDLERICTAIIDGLPDGSYSAIRLMLNAKQKIIFLEILLTSAQREDENSFQDALWHLEKQSSH
ncbi:MAG: hypothetical protein RLZZ123_1813 [Pseudomonadota bacterium]|jgi:hypothetical protein